MSKPLTEAEINVALKELKDWEYDEESIQKRYEFGDFREALAFIVRIGLEAETANHHPRITNLYNKVEISLNTHDAGDAVTQKDIDLATQIESIGR